MAASQKHGHIRQSCHQIYLANSLDCPSHLFGLCDIKRPPFESPTYCSSNSESDKWNLWLAQDLCTDSTQWLDVEI